MNGRPMKARIEAVGLAEDGKGIEIQFSADVGDGRGGSVPEGFDPWRPEFDESAPLQEIGSPAFAQWVAAQGVLMRRDDIANGDGIALLTAIAGVARNGLVMPDWLATAFLNHFIRFERQEVASLDEAFGHLPTTEKTRAAQEKRRKLIPQVSQLLVDAIDSNPERAIDNELFEEVAEQLGIGRGPCRELYDEGVREHGLQELKELKRLHKRFKKSGQTPNSPVRKTHR